MKIEFSLKEFPAMYLFASEASKVLSRGDVKNYMSIEMHDTFGNKFELRIQRVDGETPAAIAAKLRAKLMDAEEKIGAAREALMFYTHEDEVSVDDGILESVYHRPARGALDRLG